MAAEKGKVIRTVLTELAREGFRYAPAGVSVRHVHLSRQDLNVLFGEGYELHPLRDLVQPGQYAAEECVTLEGPRGTLEKVRIIGPLRSETQVELSLTDAVSIGMKDLPVRMSGHLDHTPGLTVKGPQGIVHTGRGTIIAARHLHLSDDQAQVYGIRDGDNVSVRIGTERPCVFGNVVCRVGKGHELEFHVDTDEANACAVRNGDFVQIILPGENLRDAGSVKTPDPRDISRRAADLLSGKSGRYRVYSCMDSENADRNAAIPSEKLLELVTEADINEAARNGNRSVSCRWNALITPAAADRAAQCQIGILRVEQAETDKRTGSGHPQGVPADTEILELVTAGDLNAAFRDDRDTVYCTAKALITPAAKERIAETGIRIVRL